jgi:hypothetical protein
MIKQLKTITIIQMSTTTTKDFVQNWDTFLVFIVWHLTERENI